ncbi:MAG: leucine-rich repeat domain-containing protein, partial [Oscillospiraceae bacterium]
EEITSIKIGGKSYSTSLTELDLSGKGLKNSDIKDLKYMKNLESLVFADNNISDISFVKELPNLKHLFFDNNNVSDISALKNLTGLVGFGANGNPISDISVLKNMKNLESVWLCDTKVTDISALSGCTKITELGFNNCNMYGQISALKNMKKLQKVCLFNCGISDISALSGKPDLQYIYLGSNWISDVSPLWDCAGIKELVLTDNSLDESSIGTFFGITVDGTVNVAGNGYTQEQADRICEQLSGNLEMLYF